MNLDKGDDDENYYNYSNHSSLEENKLHKIVQLQVISTN